MSENFEKLPKWAKFRIQKLERDLEDMTNDVKTIQGELGSNVQFRLNWNEEVNLPPNTMVRFLVKGQWVEVEHDSHGNLRIRCDNIRIFPSASNVIYVEPE